MTAEEMKAVIARIRAETGIDLLDPAAEAKAASVVRRRSIRQTVGTIACGLMCMPVLFLMVLTFAEGGSGPTADIVFFLGGLAAAAIAVAFAVWGWRMPSAYRDVYLPWEAAQRRFQTEIGRPWNPLGETNALGRRILLIISPPSERRKLLAAEKAVGRKANPG